MLASSKIILPSTVLALAVGLGSCSSSTQRYPAGTSVDLTPVTIDAQVAQKCPLTFLGSTQRQDPTGNTIYMMPKILLARGNADDYRIDVVPSQSDPENKVEVRMLLKFLRGGESNLSEGRLNPEACDLVAIKKWFEQQYHRTPVIAPLPVVEVSVDLEDKHSQNSIGGADTDMLNFSEAVLRFEFTHDEAIHFRRIASGAAGLNMKVNMKFMASEETSFGEAKLDASAIERVLKSQASGSGIAGGVGLVGQAELELAMKQANVGASVYLEGADDAMRDQFISQIAGQIAQDAFSMAKFADQDPELKGLCKKSDAPDLASMVMPKFCVEAAIKAVKRNQNFKSTFVRRGSAVRKNFQTFAVIQLKNILDMGQLPVDLSTTETYAYPEPVKAGVPLRFSVDSIVWKRLVQTPTKSYFTANDLRGGDAQTWKGLFWYWRAKTITSANILEWNLPSGPAGYVMDRLTDGKWNPFNRQYRMWGKIERKSSFVSEEEHAVDSGSLAKIAINASVSDPESGGAEFDLFGTSPVRDQLFDAKLNNVTGVMTLIPKRDLGFLGLKNVMPTKTVLVSPLSYFEEKNTTFSARTIEYNEVAFEQTKVREPEIDQVVKLKISNPRSQVTSMIPKGVSSSNNAISMEPAPLH